ncbi:MAG: hypothetical protein KDK48_02805 [Chlamydiia bacterium]|nr:hypothetical protein [Chlamydiia bacterium]
MRQINNPVASLDHTLLTLLGNAFDGHHDFGFVSCERPVNVAEGVLVLKKEKKSEGDCYTITNIEYTDFVHKGIEDVGNPYSKYPANTNILAVDLETVEELIKGHPFPGMLVNPKALFEAVEPDGATREVFGGRLETTMQNVADELHTFVPEGKKPSLRTFVCHGKRHKTLATTKRTLKECKGSEQTAEKAFYDRLKCHWELFSDRCGMQLDPLCSFEEFLQAGPNYLIHYIPALGPLYSVIAQKIRGGTLSKGSELSLKIAELDVENLALEGSLLIDSHNALGSIGDNGLLLYGENVGRCTLKNVTIQNKGINRISAVNYWQNEFAHTERCVIVLHGNAEFYAEDVVIRGNETFDVPAGHKMSLTASGKRLEPLDKPSWRWCYSRGSDSAIVLKRE